MSFGLALGPRSCAERLSSSLCEEGLVPPPPPQGGGALGL